MNYLLAEGSLSRHQVRVGSRASVSDMVSRVWKRWPPLAGPLISDLLGCIFKLLSLLFPLSCFFLMSFLAHPSSAVQQPLPPLPQHRIPSPTTFLDAASPPRPASIPV